MNKRIIVGHGVGKRIATLMGITPEMVSKSLNYKKDSHLARRVRYMAIKDFGGIPVGDKLDPQKQRIMKEAFRLIYGKEWKWFLSLALAMKLRLIWFLVSFVMLCALSFENSDVLCVVAFIMNFLASAIALRGVSGDGIEE